jgi:hypothetical protein
MAFDFDPARQLTRDELEAMERAVIDAALAFVELVSEEALARPVSADIARPVESPARRAYPSACSRGTGARSRSTENC